MDQPPDWKNNSGDRRDYFRIDDNVVLTYRRVPQEELPQLLKTLEETLDDSFTLTATFSDISRKNRLLNRQVRRESPVLADYFDALERKLDMLARVLMLRDMGVDEKDAQEVNLSAGGMEFQTAEFLPVGSTLEMKFMVFPSRTGILAGARVTRCNPTITNVKAAYTVAVEFAQLRESDRQLIIRHMFSKQSMRLRQERFRNEEGTD